ncbi:MAG: hypothetical protein ACPGJE_08905 [Wenzhouxiangellaceae bacterium]
MSTLSLEDLGPEGRRRLGLDPGCSLHCGATGSKTAVLPVLQTVVRSVPPRPSSHPPGWVWLTTGLHTQRAPPNRERRSAT